MSKDAYYFSHDSNARNDEKILMLRAYHGWAGYGIYWALIEMMFDSEDSTLSHDKLTGIAVSYNIDITSLKQIISTCVEETLFVSDGEKFWSESLSRRKQKFHDIRRKRSEAGKKGMAKRWGSKKDNKCYNDDITKNNKGKERKVKESKDKERPKYNFDAVHMKLAELLFNKMKENNPNAKEPNYQSWANTFRLMMDRDNREGKEIQEIILWTQKHHFWFKNILSADRLRKQYDRLLLQMKEDGKLQVISGGGHNEKPKTSYESDVTKYDFSKRRGL